jgi:phytoene dehydrogenase-like protein
MSSVVVIGAGMGGLAGSIRLAKAGFRVHVLEARSEPGGLASGIQYGGFSFDAGPYILLDRPGLEWSFDMLGLDQSTTLPLLPIQDIYDVQSVDGTSVCFYSDLEKTASAFEKRWPGSGIRYKKFIREMDRISRSLRPMLQISHPGISDMIRSGAWRQAPFLLKTLASVLRAAQLPVPVSDAIAIWTHVAGQPTQHAPSPMAFVPALMHSVGAFYPQGGIRSIPRVLETEAISAGVEFRYGVRVKNIRSEGGRIIGVETTDREFMPASAVLSNASAISSYLQLLREPPPSAYKLTRLPLQSPGVCAYVAARGGMIPPYLRFKLDEGNRRCRSLIQPALIDSSSRSQDWFPVRLLAPMDYAAAQRAGPDGQVEHLETVLAEEWWKERFPEIRVLAKRTPHQWGSEFNLYADSMNPVMTAEFMRRGRISHRSKSVRGLYLAGSSTHPGQWVSFCMISGILSANCIIEDLS